MVAFLITLYILAGLGCIPYLAKNEYRVGRSRYTSFVLSDHRQQAYECTSRAALKSIIWPYTVAVAATSGTVEKEIEVYETMKIEKAVAQQAQIENQKRIEALELEQSKEYELALRELDEREKKEK